MYVHRDIYFMTENFFECVKLKIFKFIFYYVLYGNIFLLLLIYYN